MNEITAITPQVKDKRRCNVYVDGRFCCGMTLETAVKHRLRVGQTVTEEYLAQVQLEEEKSVALDKALTHLSATRKTEKQIREYLSKKGYLDAVIGYVIEKLYSYNFLNDGEYAEAYVESVANRKGSKLIRMELRGKGISDEEIEAALNARSQEAESSAAAEILKKYLRGKPWDGATLQKAYRYLLGKGFDYEAVKSALAAYRDMDEE